MLRPMICGRLRAYRKTEFSNLTQKTISGKWATQAPAARAARFIMTWALRRPIRATRIVRSAVIAGGMLRLWNLVFMQFDRDASGKLNPRLSHRLIRGMGLERVTAVLQGVISNYDTDLFTPLIKRAAELTGTIAGYVRTGRPTVRPREVRKGAASPTRRRYGLLLTTLARQHS